MCRRPAGGDGPIAASPGSALALLERKEGLRERKTWYPCVVVPEDSPGTCSSRWPAGPLSHRSDLCRAGPRVLGIPAHESPSDLETGLSRRPALHPSTVTTAVCSPCVSPSSVCVGWSFIPGLEGVRGTDPSFTHPPLCVWGFMIS